MRKTGWNIDWQLDGTEFWLVTGISLALLLFLVIQAWRKPNPKNRVARLLCSIGLVFALTMLGLKPELQKLRTARTAIVLTDHYDPSVVDSLRMIEDSVYIYNYQEAQPKQPTSQERQTRPLASLPAPDIARIIRQSVNWKKIHIVGNGVEPAELPKLAKYPTHFYLNPLPSGFQEVAYRKTLQVQEVLETKGVYQNRHHQEVVLLLVGPGGAVDSTLVSHQNESFTLTDRPKEAGKYLYHLMAKTKQGDTLSTERIPVVIDPKRKLRVVMVNSFPRFETKYLKNWLSQEGHSVAVRSIISKNKVKDEFVNQRSITFQFTQASLKQMDLLILDAEYAQSLSGRSLANLQQALQDEGLGILIQVDETGAVPSALAKFPLVSTSVTKTRLSGVSFGIQGDFEIKQLPYLLQTQLGTLALVRKTQGQTLVGYNIKGLGGVGVSLIEESYQMLLEGKPRLYAAYWSHILKQLAKKQNPKNSWQVNTSIPLSQEKCLVTLNTDQPKPIGEVIGRSNTTEFYLQNKLHFPQKWTGSFWPQKSGWHQLAVKGDTTAPEASFYVYDQRDWETPRTTQLIQANQQWARKHAKVSPKRTETVWMDHEPIPLGYFFGLFLLCAGFLWLEPKL